MPIENKDITRDLMKMIVQQIALLDEDTMSAVNQDARASRSYWDSIGGMIDPTKYRNMLYDGTLDHAELQAEVVEHLIAIRQLIGKMDGIAAKHRALNGEGNESI